MEPKPVQLPKGKLGVLLVGLSGAVSTTFVAGVQAVRKGKAKPIGSLTQMGHIRLGKRTEHRSPLIKDFVPLAELKDLVFGGWDIRDGDLYSSSRTAGVLEQRHLDMVRRELEAIRPMKAVFDQQYVKRLSGTHVKHGKNKYDLALKLQEDIRTFRKKNNLDRVVMIWCGSTETYIRPSGVHQSIGKLEEAMKKNHKDIPPSMLYAYAAISEGVPFANGAPNLTVDIPALTDMAREKDAPIAGKDFKTGQTMVKTVVAPMLKARMLGLHGWFSSNILGNQDGAVLDDPGSFKTKEKSKLSVLEFILQPELYPDLYKDFYHLVRINYYPPRGDNKEGWDNIDIFGWLGYPMQIKIDFLCRDSILAAPIVLDLALFLDLAKRAGLYGIQEWLSFYFKSPMVGPGLYPEHDLFIQLMKLKNNLRYIMSEELITHLGVEYYE
ncbi:MAG TPA: inositol-3-phosphate synthase [Bacteroidota bacterium]